MITMCYGNLDGWKQQNNKANFFKAYVTGTVSCFILPFLVTESLLMKGKP